MNIGMELGIIIAYAIGLILLYILGWIILVPAKYTGKILLKTVVGGFLIFCGNLIGSFFGIMITINPITALIVGFLGIPGVLLLMVINHL